LTRKSFLGRYVDWRSMHVRNRTREVLSAYACIAPAMVGLMAFSLIPMVHSLYLTFFKADMMTQSEFVGLANFEKLFSEDLWRRSMLNTAYYTFGSVPLSIVGGFVIALMLNQKVKLLGLFRTIYYLPSIVSGVAVAILWILLLNRDFGLVNALWRVFGLRGPSWLNSEEWAVPGLILMSLWGVGGNMLIFLAGLQGIPDALYDAAKVDGAGTLRCFRHITIPMMTPTIFFNLIMGIIGSFQVFTPAFMMVGDHGILTAALSQVLYLYNQAFQMFRFGYASAVAWVLFAVIMFFTVILLKSSGTWVFYEGGLKS
jgi:multiple sugar transport system permease protein